MPTATHRLAAGQATPVSAPAWAGSRRHVVPFHASLSWAPVLLDDPTARQFVVEKQETPSSRSYSVGEGTGTVRHVVPFQNWLVVPAIPSCPLPLPTATQNDESAHEMPPSERTVRSRLADELAAGR